MTHTIPIDRDVPVPVAEATWPIAAKGFRPFFLLAALYAVAIVPTWLLIVDGVLAPSAYLDAVSWHAHEMVFGFTVAVLAGFLLTAVGNWTKRETLVGTPLLALAGLWCLGRVAMAFAGALPRGVPAVVDVAFLPVLVGVLARPLIATGNRKNFVMLAVLLALAVVNLGVHLDGLGLLPPGTARHASLVGIDIVLLVIMVIAGRVFPMFTRNATSVASIRSMPALDIATVLGMVVVVVADAARPDTKTAAVAAGVVAVIAMARTWHWGAKHTLRDPLLWVLHAGYAWAVLGLVLRATSGLTSEVPRSLATHALTVGAIGTLTLGMMARVSLGHTGRPLVASKALVGAFVAVNLAAVARVLLPLFAPREYFASLTAAGTLWTAAFLVFLVVYAPILAGRRVDGKRG